MRAIDHEVLELGDLRLASGELLRCARLAYATDGALNAARDNSIVFPTYCTGMHRSSARIIGAGTALDRQRYCVAFARSVASARVVIA
jgi:homoserine O-acetyltransferase